MEATEVLINRWMDKHVVYIYNGILLNIKKKEILPICDNMDGFKEYYAKWNKPDWEWKILYYFTYM